MYVLILITSANVSNFYPLEAAVCVSETQLKVGENFNVLIELSKGVSKWWYHISNRRPSHSPVYMV